MGNFQSAISSLIGGLIILVLFGCLNLKQLRRRQREITQSLYGIFTGMIASFVWLGSLNLDQQQKANAVAICGSIALLLLVVAGWILPNRHRVAPWVFFTIWATLANTLPPIVLAYLSLFGSS